MLRSLRKVRKFQAVHWSSRSYSTTKVPELDQKSKQYVYRRLLQIITSFRIRGHYAASLDPLQEHKRKTRRKKIGVGRREFGMSRSGAATYTEDFLPDVVRFLKDSKIDTNAKTISDLDLSCFPDLHKIDNIEDCLEQEVFDLYNDLR